MKHKKQMRKLTTVLLSFLLAALIPTLPAKAANIAVNASNFPDDTFRSYVSKHFDSNHDNYLSPAEIENVTDILVSDQGIQSLVGVNYFTDVTRIYCDGNDLTTLDVSQLSELEDLLCHDNRLTSLTFGANDKLDRLWCQNNKLQKLDLSNLSSLTLCLCRYNKLTSIVFKNNPCLDDLDAEHNLLKSLNLTGAPLLKKAVNEGSYQSFDNHTTASYYINVINLLVDETVVLRSPVILTQPSAKTAVEGKTVTFSTTAKGGGLSYQWQYRTSATGTWARATATGNTTANLKVPATTGRNGYQYRCVVKNSKGTAYSKAAKLTVTSSAKPAITTQPSNATVAAGGTATFKVAASGTGLSYQWQYRTSATGTWAKATATGNTTATLKVPATTGRNGYQYRCIVKNSAGTAYSKAATLTVTTATKPTITTHPANATVTEGGTATFKVAASGTGLSYQWQYRTSATGTWAKATATGNTTATLKVPATTGRNGYQYRCIVKNSAGTAYSKAATLTVK